MITNLFTTLNSAGIRYCVWKSTNHLDAGLRGETDIDLVVHKNDYTEFCIIACENGFKVAEKALDPPEIRHWYNAEGHHLHVYLKLLTGVGKGWEIMNHFPYVRCLHKIQKEIMVSLHPLDKGHKIPIRPRWKSYAIHILQRPFGLYCPPLRPLLIQEEDLRAWSHRGGDRD